MFVHYLTGIHALPVELLTRMIVLGAEEDDPYTHSPFLLKPAQNYYAVPSTQFQLIASHVCQHWRHVALRTPSLWTTLCFREVSHIPRAQAYLSRCENNPNRRLDILVDTVAPEDHIPGVTLCQEELPVIFSLIMPHVAYWRAFHLKIRDNTCKLNARRNLGKASPAPNLETLQLYHFEDFRTVQNLYIATYRPPVEIFSNSLPKLKNVSLIGVNLPWDQSPYLVDLQSLELALHPENIRPPYRYWDSMLRQSQRLQRLFLYYSGPRSDDGTEDFAWTPLIEDEGKGKGKEDECILLESLWELSLTDLDPDYLCLVLKRLVMPNVRKLSLDLPDQDFTEFVYLTMPYCTSDSAQWPKLGLEEQFESREGSWEMSSRSSTPSDVGLLHGQEEVFSPSDSSSPSSSPASSSSNVSLPTVTTNTTTSNTIPGSINNIFKNLPLPVLSTTLETLIITALECSFSAWRALIRSLVALEVLEVNFWKVKTDDGGLKKAPWSVLYERVFEEVEIATDGMNEKRWRKRMVLDRLRRCKMRGIPGWAVRKVVTERKRWKRFSTTYGHRETEWFVVEDKFAREDKYMLRIFDIGGVWVDHAEETEWSQGDCVGEGSWIQIQRITPEEDEDEEEDEGEENEEEGEVRVGTSRTQANIYDGPNLGEEDEDGAEEAEGNAEQRHNIARTRVSSASTSGSTSY